MTCDKFQAVLPDMMLDSARVPEHARQHLASCSRCQNKWNELQKIWHLLDMWNVPEPSPYFDVRLTARLREEKNSPTPSWLERMRARLMFESHIHLRPAMAAAFALLLVTGVGSYEGFVSLNRTQPQQQSVSATVKDLELLDSNAQTLQQLAAFDDTDFTVGQTSGSSQISQ